PRLHRAPLVDPVAVDRPPYLLRTRGTNRTFVGMEIEARLLERQPEPSQHRAHLGLQIGDHALVEDAMDMARQNLIEMRHQVDIVRVMASHVGEIVTERLSARKMLFEIRKA